ncbi:MAG: metallophosphoesterase family protein [Planctomycetota bacterium]|jgi:3',5'-cyclic AMP phosphodiesterase CpdA
MDDFIWLHISDTHFEKPETLGRQLVTGDLVACVQDSKRFPFKHVDAVFFTGDLAYRGTVREYREDVEPFLEELRQALNVDRDRFYLVPGNHDVDRSRIKPYHRLNLDLFGDDHPEKNVEESDRLFGDRRTLELLGEKFHGFDTLGGTYANAWRSLRGPYLAQIIEHAELKIGVIGLNSAWCVSGKSGKGADRGELLLGRRLLIEAVRRVQARKPDLTFVLSHHPVGWLKQWEQSQILALLSQHAHIHLHGHLHVGQVQRLVTGGGNLIIGQAGAVYDDPAKPRYFTVGRWHAYSGEAEFCSYVHRGPTGGGKWEVDQSESWGARYGTTPLDAPTAPPPEERDASRLADSWVPRTIPPQKAKGSLAPAIGCAFLEAEDSVLRRVRRVTYTCVGKGYDGGEWVNHNEEERFAQTFPVNDDAGIKIKVRAEFKDGSTAEPRTLTMAFP